VCWRTTVPASVESRARSRAGRASTASAFGGEPDVDGAGVVSGRDALDESAPLGAVDQAGDARLLQLQVAGEVEPSTQPLSHSARSKPRGTPPRRSANASSSPPDHREPNIATVRAGGSRQPLLSHRRGALGVVPEDVVRLVMGGGWCRARKASPREGEPTPPRGPWWSRSGRLSCLGVVLRPQGRTASARATAAPGPAGRTPFPR
jgi:hypothetical protein